MKKSLVWLHWVLVAACSSFITLQTLQLWHADFNDLRCLGLDLCGMWGVTPRPKVEPLSPELQGKVLATRPPGMSLIISQKRIFLTLIMKLNVFHKLNRLRTAKCMTCLAYISQQLCLCEGMGKHFICLLYLNTY